MCTWLTHRHGHVSLCVRVRTTAISHWIKHGKCFSWDIGLSLTRLANEPLTLSYYVEGKNTLWIKGSGLTVFYLLLPSSVAYLSLSLSLCASFKLHWPILNSALKNVQVALRRSRLLLHANVLCPTLEDKLQISGWNLSQFTAQCTVLTFDHCPSLVNSECTNSHNGVCSLLGIWVFIIVLMNIINYKWF